MNELACIIDKYINDNGIKYQFIADKIGITKQGLYQLMRKKNFSVSDSKRILSVIDCDIVISVVKCK